MKLAEILKHWYRYDIQTHKINYVSDENPTVDVNPDELNVIWYNRSSGEIFICVDNSKNIKTTICF
jgi:hypothetical protein